MTTTSDELEIFNTKAKSVYLHVPFCDHICFYCDFVKVKTLKPELIDKYIDKIKTEWEALKHTGDLQTLYIGGGTPSVLSEEQIIKIMNIFKPHLTEKSEVTIELNPESTTLNKLNVYKNNGINRISIGIQSFDNSILKKIGRKHNKETAINAFNLARKVKFDNISIDLMYNLFDQKEKHIKKDLEYIATLKPDHISWYSLILKEDSIWGKLHKKLPFNDYEFDTIINSALPNMGYDHYEISNYALNGKRSQHNLVYWTNKLFYGIGVGASGFITKNNNKLMLTKNIGTVSKYINESEELSNEDYLFQILMMGLRLTDGINLNSVPDAKKAVEKYRKAIEKQVFKGFIVIQKDFIKVTNEGMLRLNDVLMEIL